MYMKIQNCLENDTLWNHFWYMEKTFKLELQSIDFVVIGAYVAILIGLGLWISYKDKSSKDRLRSTESAESTGKSNSADTAGRSSGVGCRQGGVNKWVLISNFLGRTSKSSAWNSRLGPLEFCWRNSTPVARIAPTQVPLDSQDPGEDGDVFSSGFWVALARLRESKVTGLLSDHFFRKDTLCRNALLR